MKNIIVAVSGGRSSAMMAYHIHTSEKYKDYNKAYVFANTGMERPETIDFLKKIESVWGIPLTLIEGTYSNIMGVGVGYKIVDWDSLDMKANVFEQCIMHMNKGIFDGLPNQDAPYCSERMKTRPCNKFAKDIFNDEKYITAIGFRREDMPKRISCAEIKHDEQRIFPLLTDFIEPIGLLELNSWWNQQAFKLGINSKFGNCELCWKKSDNNLVEVIRNGTRFVDWWQRMEDQYGNTSFRNRKSIADIVAMSAQPKTMSIDFSDSQEGCMCQM
jgi:3'-phosphoadenosine 5'-phosphosulfate sulfotransferase (PAPS reductase)/FAD synthetase